MNRSELLSAMEVFRSDAWIPRAVLMRFWGHLQPTLTLEQMNNILTELSANAYIEMADEAVRVHAIVAADRAQHRAFIDAYRSETPWHLMPPDGYLHENLAYHLREAGLQDELYDLLLSTQDWKNARGDADAFGRDLATALEGMRDPLDAHQVRVLLQLKIAQLVNETQLSDYQQDDLDILFHLGRSEEALRHIRGLRDRASHFEGLVLASRFGDATAPLAEAYTVITGNEEEDSLTDMVEFFKRAAAQKAEAGQHKYANALLKKAQETDALMKIDGLTQLASRYADLGDRERADALFDEARNLLDRLTCNLVSDEASRFGLVRTIFPALLKMGRCAYDLGKVDIVQPMFEAATLLLQASNSDTGNPDTLPEKGESIQITLMPLDENDKHELEYALLYARRFDDALSLFDVPWRANNPIITSFMNFIASDLPDHQIDHHREKFLQIMAKVLAEDGDFEGTYSTLDQMATHPANLARPEAMCTVADQLWQQGKPLEAQAQIELLLESADDWNKAPIYAQIAAVSHLAGDTAKADQLFAQAEACAVQLLWSDHLRRSALQTVALKLARTGRHVQATQVLHDSRVDDNLQWLRADALYTLLTYFLAQGRFKPAKILADACQRAFAPKSDDAYLMLCKALLSDQREPLIAALQSAKARVEAYALQGNWQAAGRELNEVQEPVCRVEFLAQYPALQTVISQDEVLLWIQEALTGEATPLSSTNLTDAIRSAWRDNATRFDGLLNLDRVLQAMLRCGYRKDVITLARGLTGFFAQQIGTLCLVAWNDLTSENPGDARALFNEAYTLWDENKTDIKRDTVELDLMQVSLALADFSRLALLLTHFLEMVSDIGLWSDSLFTNLEALIKSLLAHDQRALVEQIGARIARCQDAEERASGFFKLGSAYAVHGDDRQADICFQQALEVDRQICSDYSRWRFLLIHAARLARLGRQTAARSVLQEFRTDEAESLSDEMIRAWLALEEIDPAVQVARHSKPLSQQQRAYAPIIEAMIKTDRWAAAFDLFGKWTLEPMLGGWYTDTKSRWHLGEMARDDIDFSLTRLQIIQLDAIFLYLDRLSPMLEAKQTGLTALLMDDALRLVSWLHPDWRRLYAALEA